MNVFAGLIEWADKLKNIDLKWNYFSKELWNNIVYLVWETEIKTSKEIVDLFNNPSFYDISISTEDKIVLLVDGEKVGFEKFMKYKDGFLVDNYKSFSYEWFDDINDIVEIEETGYKVIREVEKSKIVDTRVIRVDILNSVDK